MTKTALTVELFKNDLMEIVELINKRRIELTSFPYDEVEWEYYFYLGELEEKLIQ